MNNVLATFSSVLLSEFVLLLLSCTVSITTKDTAIISSGNHMLPKRKAENSSWLRYRENQNWKLKKSKLLKVSF